MFTFLNKVLSNKIVNSSVSIGAAVTMYFTPDYIDHIIQTLLVANGFRVLMLEEKKVGDKGAEL